MKFNKPKINTQKTTIQAKSKIQTAMNTTRNKLNMGTFNPDAFTIEHLTIKDRRIPKKFNNYTLVHLTDIHLGQWINKTRWNSSINKQPKSRYNTTNRRLSIISNKKLPQRTGNKP